jgi:hypothetical protein
MSDITEAGNGWGRAFSPGIAVQPKGTPYLERQAAWIRKQVREHLITAPFRRVGGG